MNDFFCSEGPLEPAEAVAAIIVLDDRRYLMQLRDQKPGIFYPGHWGLFGGALEKGEGPEKALVRELEEELDLVVQDRRFLTDLSFTFGRFGRIVRHFYEVPLASTDLDRLVVREGREMRAFHAPEILTRPRLVPYDSFAIWMHYSGVLA